MMNHEQYEFAVKRIKVLQSLPQLLDYQMHELDILMEKVQALEDACDLEALKEYEAMCDFEDRLLDSLER